MAVILSGLHQSRRRCASFGLIDLADSAEEDRVSVGRVPKGRALNRAPSLNVNCLTMRRTCAGLVWLLTRWWW
ncbi:hypothetical protein BCR33DRAFT_714265 [Rhizoclosmatium globosum]|uniref:Uncharacterized protein n=1 Tax=Rhizoclosmatium globosum TaxID=329046 RepID=A0A1Y2CQ69_9FUNG|nr:hypothetical protein BCR33DRAFT_714265 [Rhizoclosmatium globosum]|eukprot:ORY48495.1 hypothetical protein BCR33DRAFT_714265 [Rhizoclosmatium globosum]